MRWMALVAVLLSSSLAGAGEVRDPDDEIARRHYKAGSTAYDSTDYATALKEFELARRARPLPELDYNIARCHDRLEHLAEAIAAYERYLDASPQIDSTDIADRIRVLRGRLAEEQAAAARAAHPSPAVNPASPLPPPVEEHRYRLPLVVLGVTAVVGIAGAALLGSVTGPFHEMLDSCGHGCAPDAVDGLERRADAGYALLGVAAALAVADVVLFVVASHRREPVRISSTGRSLALGWNF